MAESNLGQSPVQRCLGRAWGGIKRLDAVSLVYVVISFELLLVGMSELDNPNFRWHGLCCLLACAVILKYAPASVQRLFTATFDEERKSE